MRVVLRAIVACVMAVAGVTAHQNRDVSTLLAAARQALGGEAALSAVSTFTATGSLVQPGNWLALDISCALPDKFVLMTRDDGNAGPVSGERTSSTRRQGFNGADPIDSIFPAPEIRSSFPTPGSFVIPSFSKTTLPAQTAAPVGSESQQIFAQLTVPLFATSFSGFPLTFTDGGQTPTGLEDLVVVNGPQGHEMFRLLLDAKTHVPVALTWRTLAGPRMSIGDYHKIAGGLNWPHRFTTGLNGKTLKDEKISTFTINPTIDPKTFTPAK